MTRANNLASYAAIPPTFRNRLINGSGRVDQRFSYAGTTIPASPASAFFTDRWQGMRPAAAVVSAAGGATAFVYNVTTGGAATAAEFAGLLQSIEGYNVADLGWGTANALPVTLSFLVNSTLPGTYAVRLANNAGNRSCVQTFTVNAASTWERKTITFPGDTTGTWLTNNGVGIQLLFDLGSGSSYNAPATGAWQAGNYTRTAGSVNFTAGVRACYFTSVQLEKGSVATEYEALPYDVELLRCQRYFEWVPFNLNSWATQASQYLEAGMRFAVEKRATPTMGIIAADPNTAQVAQNNASNVLQRASVHGCSAALQSGIAGAFYVVGYRGSATAEL